MESEAHPFAKRSDAPKDLGATRDDKPSPSGVPLVRRGAWNAPTREEHSLSERELLFSAVRAAEEIRADSFDTSEALRDAR